MLNTISKKEIKSLYDQILAGTNNSFEFEKGSFTDVIISAPHAVAQTREGKTKNPEPYSGIIAKLLNKYYGYTILYKSKNCNDDANYDENSPYKDFLYEKCKEFKPLIVLDLHGLSKKRDCQINLGTNYGATLRDDTEILNELIFNLKKFHITNIATDHPFFASGNTIASSVAQNVKTKAIQIEINYGFLMKNKNNILKVIKAIHYFCQSLRKRNVVRSRKLSIEKLREIDERFYNYQSLNDFEYVADDPQIVLSAPHAKAGYFNQKVKTSESMSGSICKLLYKEFGFSVIYKSKDNNIDYFNTPKNEYKKVLLRKVIKPNKTKLFLEIHILNKDRVQDVTMFLPEKYDHDTLYQIINILNRNHLELFSINSIFDSKKKARTINQVKGKCFKLQICFNQRLIEDDKSLKHVVITLKDIISMFIE